MSDSIKKLIQDRVIKQVLEGLSLSDMQSDDILNIISTKVGEAISSITGAKDQNGDYTGASIVLLENLEMNRKALLEWAKT